MKSPKREDPVMEAATRDREMSIGIGDSASNDTESRRRHYAARAQPNE